MYVKKTCKKVQVFFTVKRIKKLFTIKKKELGIIKPDTLQTCG